MAAGSATLDPARLFCGRRPSPPPPLCRGTLGRVGSLNCRFCPQPQLVPGAQRLLCPTLFRPRFWLHPLDILLERQRCPVQPFDRQLLEPGTGMLQVKDSLGRIEEENHLLSSQRRLDRVGFMIDGHTAIGAHFARKGLPMQPV